MNSQEAHEILKKALDSVSEHFDAIQFMATWNEQAETRVVYIGSGNWYARQGMAHELIEADKAQEVAKQVSIWVGGDDFEGGCDDPNCGDCYPQEP